MTPLKIKLKSLLTYSKPNNIYNIKIWRRFTFEWQIKRPIRSFEENRFIMEEYFRKILYQ